MATYLGPLTTTFTPPASCLATAVWYRAFGDPEVKLLDNVDCYPESYVKSGFYSPGTICPSGYRGYAENDGAETSINCCPSGFQFSGPWPGKCSTLETVNTISVLVTGPTEATSTQYYPPSAALWASAVQVRYRSVDTISTISPPSSTIQTSASTSFASTTSDPTQASSQVVATTTATSDPSTQDSASSLSTGAKVAIGVVVPIVALGALALIIILLRRRSRQRSGMGEVTVQELPSQVTYKYEKNPSEVQGSFVRPQQMPAELDAHPKLAYPASRISSVAPRI